MKHYIFVVFLVFCAVMLPIANAGGYITYCTKKSDCTNREFCLGECSGSRGICRPRPTNCNLLPVSFVCGCDNVTYDTSCHAHAAGTDVQFDRACGVPRTCLASSDCNDPRYRCDKMDGKCELEGLCVIIGDDVCGELISPVCSCTGITYDNRCLLEKAGETLQYEGRCLECKEDDNCTSLEPPFMGGNFFCKLPVGICSALENLGICSLRPLETCISRPDDVPVCGCDGVTYPSFCEASFRGINVLHEGACVPMNVTKCLVDTDCKMEEFCLKPDGTCDRAADTQGDCSLIEECVVPTDLSEIVCGCNGVTYLSRCFAKRARVNVDHIGPCTGCPLAVGLGCLKKEDCDALDPTVGNITKYYCAGPCGGPGRCNLAPQTCDTNSDPVCGCDNMSYLNECEARKAGVEVAFLGNCPGTNRTCLSDTECLNNEFCEFPDGMCSGTGICTSKGLGICELIFAPVCGCDGKTYDNRCLARAAGISIFAEGACKECNRTTKENCRICKMDTDCLGENEYCWFDRGTCGGDGICIPKEAGLCEDIFVPVCGCDGNTYPNECEAGKLGVSIRSDGPCPCDFDTGEGCTNCSKDEDCLSLSSRHFCKFKLGICGKDDIGFCIEKPEICILIFSPVCGCDGKTYSNECFATAAGVSVNFTGPCICDPVTGLGCTSCSSNIDCNKNEFCKFDWKTGNVCSGVGLCIPLDPLRVCNDIFMPVCGCDGKTYSNECFAEIAGVSVQHDGECAVCNPQTGENCRECSEDSECLGENEFCWFNDGRCNTGDKGKCIPKGSGACTREYVPVCGCDGKTYNNRCLATLAGISILHEGVCTGSSCSSS